MKELLSLVNYTLHNILQYDLVAQRRLQEMNGQSLCWEVQGWGLMVIFKVVDNQLVIEDRMQPCQVTVTASPQDFFALGKSDQPETSAHFSIKGNPSSLKNFVALFSSFEIDWEALFEERLGLNAHFTGQIGANIGRTLHRIRDDIRAYRRDEI